MNSISKFLLGSALLYSTSAIAQNMDIYAQVSSKITYTAKLHSSVKKDDVLIKLDDKRIKYKILAQQAKVNLAKLFYDDANKNYIEDKELLDKTVISQRDLDISMLKNFKTKYEYEEQEAILNRYKEIQKLYTITAPYNCKVESIPNKINTTNINNAKILMKIK